MTPEEAADRLESMLRTLSAEDDTIVRRAVPMLVIASGATFEELTPDLQKVWRKFLDQIGANVSDKADDVSRKAEAYYAKSPLPEGVLSALNSAIAASNRSAAFLTASANDTAPNGTVKSAPKVHEVSGKTRPLPVRIPKVFR
jgi:hypothetical protein